MPLAANVGEWCPKRSNQIASRGADMALVSLDYVGFNGVLMPRRSCPKDGCKRLRKLRRTWTEDGYFYLVESSTCERHTREESHFPRIGRTRE